MRANGPVSDEGRLALVTGANRGIGREVVRQLLEHGFPTVLTARHEDQGRAAADDLGEEFLRLDVADDASVDRYFRERGGTVGRLDVLVNNAAIDYDSWRRGVDADLAVVHQAFETNLFGAWRCCRRAVRVMDRGPGGRPVADGPRECCGPCCSTTTDRAEDSSATRGSSPGNRAGDDRRRPGNQAVTPLAPKRGQERVPEARESRKPSELTTRDNLGVLRNP